MIQPTATNKERLTVSAIASLVTLTGEELQRAKKAEPKQPEPKKIDIDLSHEKAKLAILDLYNNQIVPKFPFLFNADAFTIDNVEINEWGKVVILWRFKDATMPIGDSFDRAEYLELTQQNPSIPVVIEETSTAKEVLEELKDEHDNYIPIYSLRDRLPHLTREEQDEEIYKLMNSDTIDASTLSETWAYTEEQIDAGIPTPCGGPLFFLILN